jgi:hypothetical protein
MSLWDFARAAGVESLEIADRASRLAQAIPAFREGASLELFPGAGLVGLADGLALFLFADAKRTGLTPGSIQGFDEVPAAVEIVTAALGGRPEWASGIRVLGNTTPEPQIASGDAIVATNPGTAGVAVTWNSGSGFLTAGHVAPYLFTDVTDATGKIGSVAWTNDPAGHGALIEPDVAVVELLPGISMSSVAGKAVAGPAAAVTVPFTGASGLVMGMSGFVYMSYPSGAHGTCGDTYFTTSQITNPGDSGGPVMLGRDVIGHVIGASPGMTSYIQAIDYQMREAANPLRAGLPGLRI